MVAAPQAKLGPDFVGSVVSILSPGLCSIPGGMACFLQSWRKENGTSPGMPAGCGGLHPRRAALAGMGSVPFVVWFAFAQESWRQEPELRVGWLVPILVLLLESAPLSTTQAPNPGPSLCRFVHHRLGWLSSPLIGAALFYRMSIGPTPLGTLLAWMACALAAAAEAGSVSGLDGIRRVTLRYGFLLFGTPIPGVLVDGPLQALKNGLAWLDAEVLTALGFRVVRHGVTLSIGSALVGLEDACSGVRSLRALGLASSFMALHSLRSARRRWILIGFTLVLTLGANAIRTLALCLMAARSGVQGIDRVHDELGWMSFGAMFGGMLLIWWWLRHEEEKEAGMASGPWPEPGSSSAVEVGRQAVPALPRGSSPASWTPLAVGLLGAGALFVAGRMVAMHSDTRSIEISTDLSRATGNWRWEPEELPAAARRVLAPSEERMGWLHPPLGTGLAPVHLYYVRWNRGVMPGLSVLHHSPDVCWTAAGWETRSPLERGKVDLPMEGGGWLRLTERVFEGGRDRRTWTAWVRLCDGQVLDENGSSRFLGWLPWPPALLRYWSSHGEGLAWALEAARGRLDPYAAKACLRFSVPVADPALALMSVQRLLEHGVIRIRVHGPRKNPEP